MRVKTKKTYEIPLVEKVLLVQEGEILTGSQPTSTSTEIVEEEEEFEW